MTPEEGWEEVVASSCEGALRATYACVFRGHQVWPVVDRGDGTRSFFCPSSGRPSSLGGQLFL